MPFLFTQNDSSRRHNLLLFSYILHLLLKILFSRAEEDFFHYGGAEWHEGVEVMKSSKDGVIGADCDGEDENSEGKAPNAEEIDECEGEHTHKFEGVAELVVLLGEVCYGDESHIEYHVLA